MRGWPTAVYHDRAGPLKERGPGRVRVGGDQHVTRAEFAELRAVADHSHRSIRDAGAAGHPVQQRIPFDPGLAEESRVYERRALELGALDLAPHDEGSQLVDQL